MPLAEKKSNKKFIYKEKISSDKGVHLKPATEICKYALKNEKTVKIQFQKKDLKVSATSLLSILTLELSPGSEVEIILSKKHQPTINFLKKIFHQ